MIHASGYYWAVSPIAEINYWRSRNASLSGLFEQLQTPNVKRLLATLDEAASDVLTLFKEQMAELTKVIRVSERSFVFHHLHQSTMFAQG
jgi:hypothetical protein